MALIHPMCYKPQISTNVVLQSLIDKYVIAYQNIWGGGVVRLGAIATLAITNRCAKRTLFPARNICLVIPANNSPHKLQFPNFHR